MIIRKGKHSQEIRNTLKKVWRHPQDVIINRQVDLSMSTNLTIAMNDHYELSKKDDGMDITDLRGCAIKTYG